MIELFRNHWYNERNSAAMRYGIWVTEVQETHSKKQTAGTDCIFNTVVLRGLTDKKHELCIHTQP